MTEYIEVVPPRFAVAAHPGRVVTASRDLPLTGTGILAGTFPDGLTTIEGEPTTATVRVLYRPEPGAPGDGVVVAEVQSNQDGTWLVGGLNPELKFDVVGRKRGFNDVIMANVSPYSSEYIQLDGTFTVVKPERNALDGRITVTGGTAPYTVDVVAGAAPAGIAFSHFYGAVEASGTTEEWGDFAFTLRVTDANGVWAETQVELVNVDGQWDKVAALLHFDGDLTDETGRSWALGSASKINSSTPIFGSGSLETTGLGESAYTSNPISDTSTPFTIETYVEIINLPPPQNNYGATDWMAFWSQNQNSGNGEYGLWVQGDVFILELRASGGGSNGVTLPTPLVVNKRYHLAHTFDGTTHRAFLDGVLLVSVNHSNGWPNTNQPFRIGQMYSPSYSQYRAGGYCLYDSFRITKGLARYTESFTPPKAPF